MQKRPIISRSLLIVATPYPLFSLSFCRSHSCTVRVCLYVCVCVCVDVREGVSTLLPRVPCANSGTVCVHAHARVCRRLSTFRICSRTCFCVCNVPYHVASQTSPAPFLTLAVTLSLSQTPCRIWIALPNIFGVVCPKQTMNTIQKNYVCTYYISMYIYVYIYIHMYICICMYTYI